MPDTIDDILEGALIAAHGGIDAEAVRTAVNDGIAVIGQALAELKATSWKKLRRGDPAKIARIVTQVAKGLDDLYRLQAFAAGQPDSRPDVSGADWLRALTDEQLAIVQGWVAEARR